MRKAKIEWIDLGFAVLFGVMAAFILLYGLRVQAQTTCPAAPANPIPRTSVALTWAAPVTNTDSTPIVKPITYTVYEVVGTAHNLQCTTSALNAGLASLAVGVHMWSVTAKTTDGESAFSNPAMSTTLSAPPNPPMNLTANAGALVYSPNKTDASGGALLLAVVGTTIGAAPLDQTQGLFKDGVLYCVVPSAFVALSNTKTQPTALVTKCS